MTLPAPPQTAHTGRTSEGWVFINGAAKWHYVGTGASIAPLESALSPSE